MAPAVYCYYLNLAFVAVSVLGVRQLWGYVGEAVFWGFATASVITCVQEILRKEEKKPLNVDSAPEKPPSIVKCESAASQAKDVALTEQIGVQVLQARYGSKTKDVDVLAQIQAMVKNGILVIDQKVSFNALAGGDPAMMRTKKLRLVLLVNGQPCVKAISEWRQYTQTIGGKDAKDQHEDQAEEEAEEVDSPTKAPSGTGAAVPVVADIGAKFGSLKTSLPFEGLATEPFIAACEAVSDMSSLFGNAFLPVRANVTDNCAKIRKQMAARKAAGKSVPDLLAAVIDEEVKETGKVKKEGTICLSALWLKRALDFLVVYMTAVAVDGNDTASASQAAYKATLEPWHGFALKLTCKTAFKMAPDRQKLLDAMRNGNAEDAALLKDLSLMLDTLSPVVFAMDKWFDEQGLNFPDKA